LRSSQHLDSSAVWTGSDLIAEQRDVAEFFDGARSLDHPSSGIAVRPCPWSWASRVAQLVLLQRAAARDGSNVAERLTYHHHSIRIDDVCVEIFQFVSIQANTVCALLSLVGNIRGGGVCEELYG